MAVKDATQKVKQMEEHLEYLTHMNQRLNLVLGYAMAFVFEKSKSNKMDAQYKWLCNAVENLIYLDKPLPPMP